MSSPVEILAPGDSSRTDKSLNREQVVLSVFGDKWVEVVPESPHCVEAIP